MSDVTWRKCGASDSKCQCGLIWDVKADRVVATVNKKDESGEWSDEAFHRHADIIAAAPSLALALEVAQEALRALENYHWHDMPAIEAFEHVRGIARRALEGSQAK